MGASPPTLPGSSAGSSTAKGMNLLSSSRSQLRGSTEAACRGRTGWLGVGPAGRQGWLSPTAQGGAGSRAGEPGAGDAVSLRPAAPAHLSNTVGTCWVHPGFVTQPFIGPCTQSSMLVSHSAVSMFRVLGSPEEDALPLQGDPTVGETRFPSATVKRRCYLCPSNLQQFLPSPKPRGTNPRTPLLFRWQAEAGGEFVKPFGGWYKTQQKRPRSIYLCTWGWLMI